MHSSWGIAMRRIVVVVVVSLSCWAAAAVAAQAADPVVMAAGDVACSNAGLTTPGACSQRYTAGLALAQKSSPEGLAALIAMGDLQYESGGLSDFQKYFGTSWGQPALRGVLRPALGNHEYLTSGAAGYFDYFSSIGVPTGTRGQGWYSFDVGTWHFIALNSSNACSPVSCAKGSPQETWLRSDLAATRQPCIAAYWHHPLSSAPKLKDMWQDLYDAGADFVLDGHIHGYQKPVARNASGAPDPNGPREVVVGTGGKSSGVYGLLKLTLHANSADWRFVGSGTTDSGTATCHGPPQPPPPVKPTASFTSTTSGLTAAFTDTSTGAPTAWWWGFDDGTATTTRSPTHTYAKAGTYTVSLVAINASGATVAQKQVTVTAAGPAAGATLIADTKANAGSPAKSYGSDPTIRVRAGTYQSYLRFTVTGLSGPVTSAVLRLKAVTQAAKDGGSVFVAARTLNDGTTPWTESNLTWATMPAIGAKLGTVGPVDPAVAGGLVTVVLDPSAFAAGNGTYDLALTSTSTGSAYYASREAGGGAQLELRTP
jgi:PKD repeat protein